MLLCFTLVLCGAGAQAQKLTPGLWQHQVTMKTGSGEFTLVSPQEHKGLLSITTTRKERSETMEVRTQARWLAAACGDIKPMP